jgi:hypothetical protein
MTSESAATRADGLDRAGVTVVHECALTVLHEHEIIAGALERRPRIDRRRRGRRLHHDASVLDQQEHRAVTGHGSVGRGVVGYVRQIARHQRSGSGQDGEEEHRSTYVYASSHPALSPRSPVCRCARSSLARANPQSDGKGLARSS